MLRLSYLTVTILQVILRWWKITHRQTEAQRLNPGELKVTHPEFLDDDDIQSE